MAFQDILCNDCGRKGSARFHWLYHKCGSCGSYNTRVIKTGPTDTNCSTWQETKRHLLLSGLLHCKYSGGNTYILILCWPSVLQCCTVKRGGKAKWVAIVGGPKISKLLAKKSLDPLAHAWWSVFLRCEKNISIEYTNLNSNSMFC